MSDELPEGWIAARLSDICHVIQGQSPPGDSYNTDGNGIPFFQGKAEFGDLYATPVKWSTAPTKIAEKDDILLSIRAPVGPTNLCPTKACIGRGLTALRPKNGVSSRYVLYALRNNVDELAAQATGSTFAAVSGKQVRQHKIPLAPLEEQQRIVKEIERQLTRLDAGVVLLGRVGEALKAYRTSLIESATKGRLFNEADAELQASGKVERDFLTYVLEDRKEAFEDRGRKFRDPFPPANIPFDLPSGWTWMSWDQLSVWITYGFTRPMPHTARGVPIVTAKNVLNGWINFDNTRKTPRASFEALSPKDKPTKGDLLITKDGTIGRSAVVELDSQFCINQSVAVIWLASKRLDRRFLRLAIESPITQRQIWAKARGVAIQHLSITDFAKMQVPVPPPARQRQISREIERRLTIVQEVERLVLHSEQRADRLLRAILKHAFTGRLVPQNPSNEHASILLQRIKTEAQSQPTAVARIELSDIFPMTDKPISTLNELLERLEALKGRASPGRLLIACGLGNDVEKFFDLLRTGRQQGKLDIPTGRPGSIKRLNDAN